MKNFITGASVTLPTRLPTTNAVVLQTILADGAAKNLLTPSVFRQNLEGEQAELDGTIEGRLGSICRTFQNCGVKEAGSITIEGNWTPAEYPGLLSRLQPNDGDETTVQVNYARTENVDEGIAFRITLEGPLCVILKRIEPLAAEQEQAVRGIKLAEELELSEATKDALAAAAVHTADDAVRLTIDELLGRTQEAGKAVQSSLLIDIAALDIPCEGSTLKEMVDKSRDIAGSMTFREELAASPDGANVLAQIEKAMRLLDTPVNQLKGDVILDLKVMEIPKGMGSNLAVIGQMLRGALGAGLQLGTTGQRYCPTHGAHCPSRQAMESRW